MKNRTEIDQASFRDSYGSVFIHNGSIYRSVFEKGRENYERARDAGIYDKLFEADLLLPHKEICIEDFCLPGTVYCLSYPKLPLVSYPWEWPYSMLKDNALLHLRMMETLLPLGFWLRDASALNVQFDGRGLRFIDTLSIGQRPMNRPWVGYKQFCSHFLAPLSMAAYCDIRMLTLWRNFIDGIPLDLAIKVLPLLRKFHPRLFLHLSLHARYQEKSDDISHIKAGKTSASPKMSDKALIGLIRSLSQTVQHIEWKRSSRVWEQYDTIRTYDDRDVSLKSEFIDQVIETVRPKQVWDLGGNTGEFSIIAAAKGAFVVSIDSDPACTEYLYLRMKRETKAMSVLPLTMDLANPSPGLGWNNNERLSLNSRGKTDLLLALALIHHLVISNNIPLMNIAEWFHNLTTHLLIEYIPPSDPMIQKLISRRFDEHLPYTKELFLSSFGNYFECQDEIRLNNDRSLFMFRKKR